MICFPWKLSLISHCWSPHIFLFQDIEFSIFGDWVSQNKTKQLMQNILWQIEFYSWVFRTCLYTTVRYLFVIEWVVILTMFSEFEEQAFYVSLLGLTPLWTVSQLFHAMWTWFASKDRIDGGVYVYHFGEIQKHVICADKPRDIIRDNLGFKPIMLSFWHTHGIQFCELWCLGGLGHELDAMDYARQVQSLLDSVIWHK